MKVETYRMVASNGKHIRMATKVVLPNGQEMRFIDKLSKREALNAAREQILRTQQAEAGLCTVRLALVDDSI